MCKSDFYYYSYHNIKVLPEILKACEQLHPLEIILTIKAYIDDSIYCTILQL